MSLFHTQLRSLTEFVSLTGPRGTIRRVSIFDDDRRSRVHPSEYTEE